MWVIPCFERMHANINHLAHHGHYDSLWHSFWWAVSLFIYNVIKLTQVYTLTSCETWEIYCSDQARSRCGSCWVFRAAPKTTIYSRSLFYVYHNFRIFRCLVKIYFITICLIKTVKLPLAKGLTKSIARSPGQVCSKFEQSHMSLAFVHGTYSKLSSVFNDTNIRVFILQLFGPNSDKN